MFYVLCLFLTGKHKSIVSWLNIYMYFCFESITFCCLLLFILICFMNFRYRKSSQIWSLFLACVLCSMRWHGLKKVKDRKRTTILVIILLSIIFVIIINCSLVSSFIQVSLANTPNFFFQKKWSNGSWGNGWPWVYTSNCTENPISSTSSQLLWPAWVSFCPFCCHSLILKLLISNCLIGRWF